MKLKQAIIPFVLGALLMVPVGGYASSIASSIIAKYANVKITVDGRELKTQAYAIEDRNYTSVRDIAEAMGGEVHWNQETKTVEIYTGDIAKAATQSVSCAMILVYDDYHVLKGQGSGFYYNGYIITNKHVLDLGTKWGVQFEDTPSNMEYLMKERIEIDTGGLDIGIIRAPVEKTKRRQVTFADSDKVTVGQRVLAISSPSGVKNIISEGYVSKILEEEGYKEIVTSAQVSGGSSGGAVFDANNNLIGMIYGEISGYNGSSALIASNDIKKVLEKLR